uniref:Uncharacterized protein n=1 Tax=Ananas comosus var. bracteatus TaxID=296719 RepID=A0A6V7PPY8_ANACO|nr:unnamed protein product [Ananas comosus var. bracteatus]
MDALLPSASSPLSKRPCPNDPSSSSSSVPRVSPCSAASAMDGLLECFVAGALDPSVSSTSPSSASSAPPSSSTRRRRSSPPPRAPDRPCSTPPGDPRASAPRCTTPRRGLSPRSHHQSNRDLLFSISWLMLLLTV